MSLSVMLCAGGTGGHIFPALAVAKALQSQGATVSWIGSEGGMETRLVPTHNIPIETIPIQGLRGKGKLAWLFVPFRLFRAVLAARSILKQHRPNAVMCFGGFAAAPSGIAARWLGIPLFVHEQNRAAGLTNRLLANLTSNVLTGFPDTFPGIERYVGNPVRADIAELPSPEERLERELSEHHLLADYLEQQRLKQVRSELEEQLLLEEERLKQERLEQQRLEIARLQQEELNASEQKETNGVFGIPTSSENDKVSGADSHSETGSNSPTDKQVENNKVSESEHVSSENHNASATEPEPAAHTESKIELPTIGSPVLPPERPLRILVLGGSQGAKGLNEGLPNAFARLSVNRIDIRHQCGEKQFEFTQNAYNEAGVRAKYSIEKFIADMPKAYYWADVVVCRAGASTLAELCAAGLPSILVPFPAAVDDHQTKNAKFLVKQNAAYLVPQNSKLVNEVERLLQHLLDTPERRLVMANAARELAKPNAAEDIARIVVKSLLPE